MGKGIRGNSHAVWFHTAPPTQHGQNHHQSAIIFHSSPLDKMASISQMTISNAFSWAKMYEFRLKCHWNLFLGVQFTDFFLGVQLTLLQHWCRSWLGTDQVPNHYWNQWWLVYWCINVSLGLSELIKIQDKTIVFLRFHPEHYFIIIIHTTSLFMQYCYNKVWWLCLVPTSITSFASDVGYRMAKI